MEYHFLFFCNCFFLKFAFADTPQTGTTLSDNGRTISYLPGDAGYRCFISKRAFDKGKHYIEVRPINPSSPL